MKSASARYTITSIVERDGPWRSPEAMFPSYDPEIGQAALGGAGTVFVRCGFRPDGDYLPDLRCSHAASHHPRRYLHGRGQGLCRPIDFPKQRWLNEFRASGLAFEDIDYVFCTHLHIDHCGWNTRLLNGRWVPTFPNAKYVFHKREYAAWEAATARGENPPGAVWRMNCLPVVEAGQALLVDDDFALDDTIMLSPTPGHSPCHCCVNIRSGGQRASVTGDLMHHVLQCREPNWSTIFCADPAMAARSRRRFLGEVADTDVLILPVHFPSPTAGRVEGDGERFRFRFRSG